VQPYRWRSVYHRGPVKRLVLTDRRRIIMNSIRKTPLATVFRLATDQMANLSNEK
jgi:hypothetical protein